MNKTKTSNTPHSLATSLARRAAFEELVGKASRRYVGIGPEKLDPCIVNTLAEIGEFVGADRSYVFLYDRAAGTMSNTHEWCAESIEPQQAILQDLPVDVFAYAVEYLEKSPVLEIPLVSDLPPEASAEQEILQAQDILSLVLVSVRGRKGEARGFIGFDAVREVRPWQDEDVYLLEIVGGIIAAAVEHREVMAQLSESEARNRATIEAVPDLLFILNENGTILDFKAPPSSRLAVSPENIKGSSVWSVIGPEYHGHLARAMVQAGQKGKSGEFEYTIDIDGQVCYFEGRLTLQKDGEYLALVRDITSRHESEEALRRLALELSSAEEAQRRELALQLHDGIGQELTGLMFRLQSLGLADESGKIDEAVKILQKTMRRTQDLTFDLSPPILYELGLAKALQALIIRFDTHEDADFTILVEEEPRDISHSVGILLYRIARELLLNVVKHADATFVELRLSQNRDRITLSVTDDGRGMDVGIENSIGKQARGGFGLFSIRQRLEPLGGKLHLETHSGTTVKVTIPRFQEESGTTLEATS